MSKPSYDDLELPFAPAAERNQAPILAELRTLLSAGERVLEIGAGTGQHAVAFASGLDGIHWTPSDVQSTLEGLARRVNHAGIDRLHAPIELDVQVGPWPEGPFDAAYTANTCHIMGWCAVEAMFEGVSRALMSGGRFLVYGPFTERGLYRSEGDERFDRSLRLADPEQGLRDLEALETLAARHHFSLTGERTMPANNLLLIFRKGGLAHD